MCQLKSFCVWKKEPAIESKLGNRRFLQIIYTKFYKQRMLKATVIFMNLNNLT